MMIRTMATLTVALAFAACATVASTVGFPVADDDDNNTVSRTEYTEAVDAIYETDAYFRGLDRDRNGTLSRDEFINGWFTMFDTDRNGSLNRSEYRSAMDALNFEL